MQGPHQVLEPAGQRVTPGMAADRTNTHPALVRSSFQLCLAFRHGLPGCGFSSTSADMSRQYTSFAAFWPFYLRDHSPPRTRALHYIGTTLAIGVLLFAVVTGRWLWLLAFPVAGYFFAWLAHFTVEKNRPATFTYPLWSLAADFRMWWLWLTRRLQPELDRAGVGKQD